MTEVEVNGEMYRRNDSKYDEPYKDPELLNELYHDEGMDLSEVGDALSCSTWPVQHHMDKNDISRRNPGTQSEEPWHDREKLYNLYVEEGLKQSEIAEKWDCSRYTISDWINRHDIETQHNRDSPDWASHESLKRMYCDEKMSLNEIAEKVSSHKETIRHHLRRHGIERRDSAWADRVSPPKYYVCRKGYVKIGSTGGVMGIHRLIMIAEEGIETVKDMEVHHQNRIPWDNRIDNMELLTTSEHAKLHNSS